MVVVVAWRRATQACPAFSLDGVCLHTVRVQPLDLPPTCSCALLRVHLCTRLRIMVHSSRAQCASLRQLRKQNRGKATVKVGCISSLCNKLIFLVSERKCEL
eukprot:365976-Chlamydomonas_euryale.AAC.2